MQDEIVSQKAGPAIAFPEDFRAAGTARGGGSGNTHPANRQGLEVGGEDTVVLSLGVKWREGFEELMNVLEKAKTEAKSHHEMVLCLHGGRRLGVSPSGTTTGGGRGSYFAYRVTTAGYVFHFSCQPAPVEQTPNVMVEAGSEVLMAVGGLGRAWSEIRGILEDLGGYVSWSKLSRLDVCVDLPGVSVSEFVRLFMYGQRVCRARSESFYREGEHWTGVTVGKGDIVARVYDKAYEVQVSKPHPEKQRILEERRWGGPQKEATRVEFQLRREALKSLGVDSMQDYYRLRSRMVEYLTHDWLRLLEAVPDRENNNTTRTATHALWSTVTQRFRAWAGAAALSATRASRRFYRDPVRVVKQAAGCLLSAVYDLVGGREISPVEFVEKAGECLSFIVDRMPEWEFTRRYRAKGLPCVLAEASAI